MCGMLWDDREAQLLRSDACCSGRLDGLRPDGVMALKGPTEVDSDGMMVVVSCGTTENPSSSVPTLVVLAGLTEIGCEVVVAAGTTDVVGKEPLSPPPKRAGCWSFDSSPSCPPWIPSDHCHSGKMPSMLMKETLSRRIEAGNIARSCFQSLPLCRRCARTAFFPILWRLPEKSRGELGDH